MVISGGGSVAYGRTGSGEALRMITSTPAAVLGLPAKGRITPGADADLVVLSAQGEVRETVVAGRIIYGPRKDVR